jgi:amino acid adenylation domain-containing protein
MSKTKSDGLSTTKRALLELKLRRKSASLPAATIPRRRDPLAPAVLSFAQRRLWFLDQFYGNSCTYNVPRAVRLSGLLSVDALEKSLNSIVARHEALRTTFKSIEGTPVQLVTPNAQVPFRFIDLAGEREEIADLMVTEEIRRPFDLSRDIMLRATLFRLGDREHILVLVTHHIASDGWSKGLLYSELAACYNAFSQSREPGLAPLALQYADFSIWQNEWLQGQELQQQLEYWKKQLAGAPDLLDLPTDRPRGALPKYSGAKLFASLPGELIERVRVFGNSEGATLFMTLLAAFQALLYRYSGQEDIVVGTPVAGRVKSETELLIGDFVNMLVLRTDLSGSPSFRQLLSRVREMCLEAYDNQLIPFEKLVEELERGRDLSRAPLFQAMFALENTQSALPELAGLDAAPQDVDTGVAKNDLIFSARQDGSGLRVKVEYSTELFDESTISRLVEHFERLLEAIVANPDTRVDDLCLLTQREQRQLLVDWNDTDREFPATCIHNLFEEAARRYPDRPAVRYQNTALSYAQLNARANQLAHYLRKQGVGPDSLVGLYVERSLDMVVGLMGILKSGGAYVPLDPVYPRDRVDFMLADAEIKVLVTQASLADQIFPGAVKVVCLDEQWHEIERESSQNPSSVSTPDNLCYVIFTSGSTGRPKGVQLEHRNVVNFLTSVRHQPGLTENDVYLGVASMSFDASVLDFYLPLTVGACLVVVDLEALVDGRLLAKTIESCRVSAMHATPSSWRLLLDSGWEGKPDLKILAGGEALPWELARQLLTRCGALWNLYGPTETAVYSTIHRVKPEDGTVLVGRPIANTRIYILDPHLKPVPVGVSGELSIGGEGVSRGYMRRTELTTEKFLADPFRGQPGGRMYRTGDLARYRANGLIACLGRIDHQVKIRGFRVELGEIEAVLATHPAVEQCVVVALETSPGDRQLVAYLVSQSLPHTSELRSFLHVQLPDYMVPSAFVTLPTMPLSPNGKIDRRALPAPGSVETISGSASRAPETPLEVAVAEVWSEVLKRAQIGVQDNFFEIGGHSLNATQVVSRLRDRFALEFSPRVIFEAPTIAELAGRLKLALMDQVEADYLNSVLTEIEAPPQTDRNKTVNEAKL